MAGWKTTGSPTSVLHSTFARLRGQAVEITAHGAEEELVFHDGRRGERAIEQFLIGLVLLAQRLFPEDLVRQRIGAADRVAMCGVKPAPRDEGLGALVGPDRMNVGLAQVVHGLEHLGIALGVSETDVRVALLVARVDGRTRIRFSWSR